MGHVPDLVYDVGMHNGDDTAYYLHKGFRVIAIDANPVMVERGRARFAPEIAAGRLELLNVGIADAAGTEEFFVPPGLDVLGSFDATAAARGGELRSIRVECTPFRALLDAHGVPFYLKVDIEGRDWLCLAGLDREHRPAYVSFEMSYERGDHDIAILAGLGYRGFKCIRQNDFMAITSANAPMVCAMRRWRERGGARALAVRAVRRALGRRGVASEGGWRFAWGSSGAMGESTDGPWLDAAQVAEVWRRLRDVDRELSGPLSPQWFDIHARLDAR